jgi:hypothetical protein
MLFFAAAVLSAAPAFAEGVPLPRPRPPEADRKPPQPVAVDAKAVGEAMKICEALFKADIAEATLADPMAWDNGCLAAAPVHVTAIKLAGGKKVELRPAATLRCTTAMAIANWVRDDLEPGAAKLGTRIERIDVAASFACRPRNNVFGAKLSEHGKANALDIRALHFADGRTAAIQNAAGPLAFFAGMRKSACRRFMTVLGPGSDKPHETHLHVDLQERRNNYKICQWILPKPDGETSHHEQASRADLTAAGNKAAKNK